MNDSTTHEITVWDRFVRVFHWATVALFVLAFATADDFETPHQLAGYAILTLVSARIVWGFAGRGEARFSAFVRPPGAILAYLGAVARRRAPRHLGHNPAGGAMVLALLAALLVVTLTGVAQTLDAFADIRWIEKLHEAAAKGMLALIALHLAGVLATSLDHDENLVAAMITGRKRRDDAAPPAAPVSSSLQQETAP